MKALIALLSLFASSTVVADAQIPVGVWKLIRYVDMTATSTSPADIKRHLGKAMTISDAGITFGRKRCNFEGQEVLATDDEADAFFLMNKSFYDELHIHSPVTIIDTSCNMIIVGSRGETFIEWEGNVYAAKKVKVAKAAADVPPDSK